MGFVEIVLLALGLAMDAFAVSVATTVSGKINNKRAVFRLSFHFGLFQFLMPVIGWFTGDKIASYLSSIDHWIAFVLLSFVGIHMISGALRNKAETGEGVDPSRGLNLVILSLATSLDALAVGFSLAMIRVDIWYPSVVIGLITAGMSLVAIRIGNLAGRLIGRYLSVTGGIILIIIGFRILVSDL